MSHVRVSERAGVQVLTLDRPPANAFNPDLVEDLRQALRDAARAPAVVLASSLTGLFSAGWDLKTVQRFDRTGMEGFVDAYCDLVREVFVFGPPLVVALSGHAIAGGLIVAAAGDERIAAQGPGLYGLSEVHLGVPVPQCLLEIFRHVMGARGMERLAATGENILADRALALALVDRIVAAGDLMAAAVARGVELAKLPAAVYSAIKRRSRSAALARYDRAREGDQFLDVWFGAEAQGRIGALVAKLSKKA